MDEADAKAGWIQAVLERHGSALTRYAASILRCDDLARDVVQDVFVRLCEQSPGEVDGHLTEWLYTVCRRRAIDALRRNQRMQPATQEDLEATFDPEESPARVVENGDTLQAALGLLRELPPRQQELVRLKFQGGLSYAEISRVTQLSVSNVGFILHTALKTLRERLHRTL